MEPKKEKRDLQNERLASYLDRMGGSGRSAFLPAVMEDSPSNTHEVAEPAETVPPVAQQEDEKSANEPDVSKPKEFVLGAFEATLEAADNFVGYKLKNEGTEGSWRHRLSTMVYRQGPNDFQRSSDLYMRLFVEANMLVVDPWSIRTIMPVRLFAILDDGCLHRIKYSSSRHNVGNIEKVMTLYPSRRERSLPPSVQFIHPTCAVVCDGGRVLTVYETDEDRTKWESFFEYRIVGPQDDTKPGCDRPPKDCDFGFVIVDARLTMAKQQIDVCVRAVRDHSDGRPLEDFVRWITIWMPEPQFHVWELKRHRSIVCPPEAILEFVGFDRNCDNLIFIMAKTTKKPTVELDEKMPTKAKDPCLVQVIRERDSDMDRIVYVWYQTEEEVVVMMRLEQEDSYLFDSNDISFEATETRLTIKAKGEVVLEGEMGGSIETDLTQWELHRPTEGKRRLEFSLKKKKGESPGGSMGGLWYEVVRGDGRGKYLEDASDMEWSMQALDVEFVDNEMPIKYKHATGVEPGTSSTEKKEECDDDDLDRFMWYLNETNNDIHHYCNLTGTGLLFATKAFPPLCQTRAICIREGDHGYVYNFEIFPPRHIQILKRGKSQCRYPGVSPHGGYAFVVDATQQAYVYWQTRRNTHGEINQYKDVASREYDPEDKNGLMQIVFMRGDEYDEQVHEHIMGFVATEDSLVLLSEDTLVIHRLRVPPVTWAKSAEDAGLETR